MFDPFKMPDFCSRPDGRSKTLKEAYIFLRTRGFPDSDIFIFPQGEFSSFKGEILEQQPHAGEMVHTDARITLIAAVRGTSHILPDLFTDQKTDFFSDDRNPRHGAKNLFAIFDSMFLKMRCRLEWIRDVYAGVFHSPRFVDYLNSVFFVSGNGTDRSDLFDLGFILSRLSRFKGTEGAIRVLLESLTGLKVDAEILGNRKVAIPAGSTRGLGENNRLGENMFLGERFESERSELSFKFRLDGKEEIPTVMEFCGNREILEDVRGKALPFYLDRFETSVDLDSVGIDFTCGSSYLGFSTAMGPDEDERS
jgi:hypothetical protein